MNKNNSAVCNSIENISIEYNSIKNNSLETIDKTVLSEQTKFRLCEMIGIENYFYQEINQRNTPYLEANNYLSKICKSISCIFSKYYMLTHKKQKNENFLFGQFFLMWA